MKDMPTASAALLYNCGEIVRPYVPPDPHNNNITTKRIQRRESAFDEKVLYHSYEGTCATVSPASSSRMQVQHAQSCTANTDISQGRWSSIPFNTNL